MGTGVSECNIFHCIFLYIICFWYHVNVLSLKLNKIQNINDDNIYISCKKYSQSVSWYNKELKIILVLYPVRGISHWYNCYVFAEIIWKGTTAAAESEKAPCLVPSHSGGFLDQAIRVSAFVHLLFRIEGLGYIKSF